MRDNSDADLTLPSVAAALPGTYREEALTLTVVFHPDASRIGATAELPLKGGPWMLGRLGPVFSGVDPGSERSLEDLHVSRRAVQLCWQGNSLEVTRIIDSSRCRLNGRELSEAVSLSRETLCVGVPVMLGHSVVLLLRFGSADAPRVSSSDHSDILRGSSASMASLREQIRQVATSDLDVLIRGETGTGKELVATAIHRASRRSDAPLVSVNMTAIPTGLAAAALFGSVKGAYTGADRAGSGYFRQAEGGTLFLDEVGDTPAEIQPQLLRALQQREIQSVGGPVKRIDLRVISATDAALDGPGCDFRSALRHRLGASEFNLLPLRERPEDIGELFWYFLASSAAELGYERALPGKDSGARELGQWAELFHRFLVYPWPGNVRELSNLARQVILASENGLVVPPVVMEALEKEKRAVPEKEAEGRESGTRGMREVEESEFERAMADNCFEVAAVARELNVSRQSVYRRIEDSPRHRLAAQIPPDELQQALTESGGDVVTAARRLGVSPGSLRARLRNTALEWH